MADYVIRDWRLEDLPRVLELNESNLPHVSTLTSGALKSLAQQARYFRIAEWQGHLSAFLLGLDQGAEYQSENFAWFKNKYNKFLYIDRIITASNARGHSLASGLYADIELFARANAIPVLTCEVNIRPENLVSLTFHEKLGYHQVGIQDTEGGKKTVSLLRKTIR